MTEKISAEERKRRALDAIRNFHRNEREKKKRKPERWVEEK